MFRVLLSFDDALFRLGVQNCCRSVLAPLDSHQSSIQEFPLFRSTQDVARNIQSNAPTLVLAQYSPAWQGDILLGLRRTAANLHVTLFFEPAQREAAMTCLWAGVDTAVQFDISPAALGEMIASNFTRMSHRRPGYTAPTKEIAQSSIQFHRRSSPPSVFVEQDPEPKLRPELREVKLSQREADVLRLLYKDRSIEYMAATLGISIHTVRAHINRLLLKLDAGNLRSLRMEIHRNSASGLLSVGARASNLEHT